MIDCPVGWDVKLLDLCIRSGLSLDSTLGNGVLPFDPGYDRIRNNRSGIVKDQNLYARLAVRVI